MDVVQKEPQEPEREREDPTELARPSGVVTTGTTGASAETESGTEGGEAPVAEKEPSDGCIVAGDGILLFSQAVMAAL